MWLAKDSGSWNSRIVYHVKSNQFGQALVLYYEMMENFLQPSGYTLVSLVNACADLRNINDGNEFHAEIARKGLLDIDLYAGNAVINLYLKCGLLSKAREVFDHLPVRDVVSWTSMIGGYVTYGLGVEALTLFEVMQDGEQLPNNVTFICTLKACGLIGSGVMGKEVHDKFERGGMPKENLAVGNALIDMYVKCGMLQEGQKNFDKLIEHDRISWSALIMGYINSQDGATALQCFKQMQLEGLLPDAVAFICILKAGGLIKHTNFVQEVHSVIVSTGLLKDPVIGNTILDAYACCGSMPKAEELFHKLPVLDTVSWNTLVDGFVRQDCGEKALLWTVRMQLEASCFDVITCVCCLKACSLARYVHKGKKIHASLGSLQTELLVGNALIDMYAKFGLLLHACEVFGNLMVRDVISWTTLITGFVNHQRPGEALKFFQLMSADQVSPNAATIVFVLKASGHLKATQFGMEIHSELERQGILDKDIAVSNALIDMYSKCDMLRVATEVFERACSKNVTSWNAVMTAYAWHGHVDHVLDCMRKMARMGISPNSISYLCSVKTCGSAGLAFDGIELHAEVARNGLFFRDSCVGNALVDMYMNFGLLDRAKDVFHELPYQNILSWTSLITGYVRHEHVLEALVCFDEMNLNGMFPDAATYICILKACKIAGAVGKGQEIHSEIARLGLLNGDPVVGNSLVEMYASCGLLETASVVLTELRDQDAVSWTALIAGYVQLGEVECALHAFEKMIQEGKTPDKVTFLWLLIGCASASQIGMAEFLLKAMIDVYHINPSIQHYTCVADLLCRSGLICQAIGFIDRVPFKLDYIVWYMLLDACQKFGCVEACRQAFEKFVGLDTPEASTDDSMCKLYASPGSKQGLSIHGDGDDEFVCFHEGDEVSFLVSSWA